MVYVFTVSGDYQIPKEMEKDESLHSIGIHLSVINAHTVYGYSSKKHPYEVITILMKLLGVTRLRIEAYSRYYPNRSDPTIVDEMISDASDEYAILSYTDKKMALASRFRGLYRPLELVPTQSITTA